MSTQQTNGGRSVGANKRETVGREKGKEKKKKKASEGTEAQEGFEAARQM